MEKLYKVDNKGVFTGLVKTADESTGRPPGFVKTEPPVTQGDEVAQFRNGQWVVLDAYPVSPARPPVPQAVPQAVPALEALLALDAAGLSADYEAWANDPARTFAERAFINKALTWRRDDPTLQAAAEALELSSEQVDQLFIAADQALAAG